MIRIGWFCPVSSKTGIAQYARNVLLALRDVVPPGRFEVVVFHPPTEDRRVSMPCPTVEIGDSLLRSDFHALFDVAIYHLGNNDLHHGPIYAALRRHPGIVVLHDHVYQHYLAGVSLCQGHVGPAFGALLHDGGGQDAFDLLADSGVLPADQGRSVYVPWEGQWATQVPLGDLLARLGTATVVHSAYAEAGLGADFGGPVLRLFMPPPPVPDDLPEIAQQGRIHIACCGHIGPTKGLQLLVSAFARDPALRQAFRVTIAGFGSDANFLAKLRSEIRNTGLGGVFEFVVDPDDDAFAAVMAAADIFYNLRHPNTEGASLSLVEQFACGRPVIAYRSGCFAEASEDACYFLDRVGDADALGALLGRIAAERADLPRRGAAARAAVHGRSAADYATGLAAFVEGNIDLLVERARLAHSRAAGRLPEPAARDAAWLRDVVAAHFRFDDFYNGRLFLPLRLDEMSAEQKAAYLVLNLLAQRPAAPTAIPRIAALIAGLGPLETAQLFGELLLLSERFVNNRGLLPQNDLLPGPEGRGLLAQVLLCLDPLPAARMLAGLLGIGGESLKGIVSDVRAQSVPDILIGVIERDRPDLLELAAAAGILHILRTWTDDLPDLPADLDLLAVLRDAAEARSLRLHGFHGIEEIGIWTARPEAGIRLCLAPNALAGRLEMDVSTLLPERMIVVEMRELQSGRRARSQTTSGAGSTRIGLTLPGFAGPVEILVATDKTASPASLDLSVDSRPLGILIHNLRLGSVKNPGMGPGTVEPAVSRGPAAVPQAGATKAIVALSDRR